MAAKDFQEITLTDDPDELSIRMVGMPGIITMSGDTGTATGVEVVLSTDISTPPVPANDVIRLNIPDVVPVPFVNPVLTASIEAAFGYSFPVQASRLTFKLVGTADGDTAVVIRWFPVATPY